MLKERAAEFMESAMLVRAITPEAHQAAALGIIALAKAIVDEIDEDSGSFGQEVDLGQIRSQCEEIVAHLNERVGPGVDFPA